MDLSGADHLQNVLTALQENYTEQELQKRIVLGNNYPGIPKHIPEGGGMTDSIQKETKWCPQCEDHRPVKEFGNKTDSPDGLNHWCKPCTNKKAKEYAAKKKENTTTPKSTPKNTEDKNNDLVIPVDLTDLDWVYNELEFIAKRDERTMAAQIRYYLKQISRGDLVTPKYPSIMEQTID